MLPLVLSLPLNGAPTGVTDNYLLNEESVLVEARSVLANDLGEGTELSAVLETGPSNGFLEFRSDGTFIYVPDLDFSGTDSFTYRAVGSLPPVVFTVDSTRSNTNINATLGTSFGEDDSSDASSVSGTVRALLSPDSLPYNQIQIDDLNLVLDDALSFRFSFAFGLAGVNADVGAGAISVTMNSPGAPSAIDGAGNFNQTGNELRIAGVANVSGTGLADGQVPEGPQNLDTPVPNVDLGGTLVENGGILTLTVPLNFTGSFDVAGNTLDLEVTGTVVATAPVPAGGEQSGITTVNLNVTDRNDAPGLEGDIYYMNKNGFLDVGANEGATDVLISKGSSWQYLDDGSDQGTTWREEDFDDGAWASGNGELGFGDGGENTAISSGALTYYFRKEFEVLDARDISELRLNLLRDDGAIVYLNGVQVVGSNMPALVDFTTLANTSVGGESETRYFEYEVDPLPLVEGTNVLAVEVHQSSFASSDLSFDLELLRFRQGGVLSNDEDEESDAFSAGIFAQSSTGTANLDSDGAFSFVPQAEFSGETGFLYTVDSIGEVPSVLLPTGSVWRYLDDGSDQGTAWRAVGFDDSGWTRGSGELGYGDGDELTEVGFGGDEGNKFATTYFRNDFFIADATNADLTISMKRDDAAAVYLNGVEIYRDTNLAAGAIFSDYASGNVGDENAFVAIPVPVARLVEGKNVLAVEVHQATSTSSDLSFALEILANLPAMSFIGQESIWKYLDDGSNQLNLWTANAFDDVEWLSGAGPFGYGNGDEATEVSFGGDSNNKHETTYFRKAFEVPDQSLVKGLLMRFLSDDGIAVYLNGTEVFRDNLVPAAGFDDLATAAVSGIAEQFYREVTIDPAALMDGQNVIAVEVHQSSLTSSDLAFDLELLAIVSSVIQRARVIVLESEAQLDSDNDGMLDSYERVYGLIVGIDDSAQDPDGDGQLNIQESYAQTDPFDRNSVLKITAISTSADMVDIDFSSVAGVTYGLERSIDLENWEHLAGVTLTADEASERFTVARSGGVVFWRVIAGP